MVRGFDMRPRTLSEILADDSDDEKEETLLEKDLKDNLPQLVAERKFDEIILHFPAFLKKYPRTKANNILKSFYNKSDPKTIKNWVDLFIILQKQEFNNEINFPFIWLDFLKHTKIDELEQKNEDTIKYYSQLIHMLITQYSAKDSQFLEQFAINNNFLFCLLESISLLEPKMKKEIQDKLLQLAIEKYNPFLLESFLVRYKNEGMKI